MSVVTDEAGVARCGWSAGDDEYRRYHDEEWGVALHGDRPLFEKLSLEGFQAGLSWITILRRRPNFRRAFADFEIDAVAELTTSDVERLMLDPGIIRNRAKIVATISNARITRELVRDDPGALDRMIWSFAPHRRARPPGAGEVPAVTAESTAMSKALRGLGYRFVGPTTLYALMQASGMVDDHFAGCWRAGR
ncbi:DNA-3-methyladenine glycosylase I [Marisediminicola sp. UYEF4]|uniref:DNA-3-methyladenine glycosylase I n=1 Tax=Marisediminicola sp. UYEF4 TaxID=1756384 RepID=UPI0033908DB5